MRTAVQHEALSRTVSELRLPARPSELRTARQYAEEAAAAFGLDADGCYELALAFNEAVTNAIRHGAPDSRGQIRLSVLMDADRLTLTVHDHGTFAAPVLDRARTCEQGRGLALMASLMDVQICAGPAGTTVRLSKARADDAPATNATAHDGHSPL